MEGKGKNDDLLGWERVGKSVLGYIMEERERRKLIIMGDSVKEREIMKMGKGRRELRITLRQRGKRDLLMARKE